MDDVDSLFPGTHTDLVKWLPPVLPPGTKVVLTSSSDSFLQGFRRRYDSSNVISVPGLDPKECLRVFPGLRGPSSVQDPGLLNQALFCLQQNSTPLFFQSLVRCVQDYRSSDLDRLSGDPRSILGLLLDQWESRPGGVILRHILSYLALSRFGLSLSELSDLLTLDNLVLAILEVRVPDKPVFRFPTSLTLFFLSKVPPDMLVLVQTSARVLVRLRHQVLVSTILDRVPLGSQDGGSHFFRTLLDFWTSRYSGGDRFKPVSGFEDEDEVSGPDSRGSRGSQAFLRRGVAPQPYFSVQKKLPQRVFLSNSRKLVELPNLLVRFSKVKDLLRLVVFNFEFLFASLNGFGMNHLVSELYFTRQISELRNDPDLELLLAQLRLLGSEVVLDSTLLGPELSGRLCHLVGSSSGLSSLILQIDSSGPRINSLLSLVPNYATIDMENMRVDLGPPATLDLITSTLSIDFRFVSTLVRDPASKEVRILVWDSKAATKTQIISLGRFPGTSFSKMFYMPQGGEFVVLQFEDSTNSGLLIVNLEFSSVDSSLRFPRSSLVRVENVSKSHLYLTVDGEIQIYTHPSGERDPGLSKEPWPTRLSPNDKYLLGPRPASKKTTDPTKTMFNLRVANPSSGDMLCQLTMALPSSSMVANVRNETLFVGTKTHGIINRFDIGQIAKKDAKSLKSTLELRLEDQSTLDKDLNECVTKFYPNVRVSGFQLSVDEKFLVSEYILNESLRAFAVWNLTTKCLVQSAMLDITATVAFSTDGQFVYHFQRNGTLKLYNLGNNTEYNLTLKDIPEQIYMLKSGSFFMTFTKSVKLTTIKGILQSDENQEKSPKFREETFCTSLLKPKISSENGIVYSNYEETSNFVYFKLSQNSITTLDISHTNESLTKYSSDRFLSPSGNKLLLVFGFRLSNLIVTDQEYDIDLVTLQPGINGHLINCLNDYRKPQIPNENYFTGKTSGLDKKGPGSGGGAYDQKIVKVVDLISSRVVLQVSLTGERILLFTDQVLLTLKPDYASLSQGPDGGEKGEAFDIVSVYDVPGAQFVSCLFLEHPLVDLGLVSREKEKMVVCCGSGGRILRVLAGDFFSSVLLELNVQTMLRYLDEFARSSSVSRVFLFQDQVDGVLLQFSWLDSGGRVKTEKETFYARLDLVKKEVVSQFSSLGKVTDVSRDGTLAVDSLLNVFDLTRGTILRKLQASIGRSEEDPSFSCFSLFSGEDGGALVTLDSKKNVLWVLKNEDQGPQVVGKALLTSSFEGSMVRNKSPFQIHLVLEGHIVVVHNDREFKVFVIRLSPRTSTLDNGYKTNIERIKKNLVP